MGSMQYRVNCFHENDGMAVAIRALYADVPAVENIGFPNGVWRDIVVKQQGLVIVTGVTGAGKSTTIASLINHIAQIRPCRIITLEDPIEYRLASKAAVISQRELGRDVPSFERGLRDCLREDPDVIFVGEMRDKESTTWTLTAAETGHLVFSTLHTRDARGTITRVLDLYPPEQQDEVAAQLSLGLSHIISQKLIPRADGQGRVVVMEILNNVYGLANQIRQGKTEQIYTLLADSHQGRARRTDDHDGTVAGNAGPPGRDRAAGGGEVGEQSERLPGGDAAADCGAMRRKATDGGRQVGFGRRPVGHCSKAGACTGAARSLKKAASQTGMELLRPVLPPQVGPVTSRRDIVLAGRFFQTAASIDGVLTDLNEARAARAADADTKLRVALSSSCP